SACSWVMRSFLTWPPSWPSVTARAFSKAASTNFWSMSLTTTGMSAAAIAWAISPPIVPPPTTAALLTNIRPGSSLTLILTAAGGRANWEAIRMEAPMTSDRDELLAFELALDEQVCDEVHRESWGRLFLTRSAPLIWDANWCGIEEVGLSVDQVV